MSFNESQLAALKAGDEVGIGDGSSTPYLHTIKRVTPTMIVFDNHRFNRKTGRAIGEGYSWHPKRLINADSAKRQIHHAQLLRFAQDYRWSTLKVSQLESLKALLESFKDVVVVPGNSQDSIEPK